MNIQCGTCQHKLEDGVSLSLESCPMCREPFGVVSTRLVARLKELHASPKVRCSITLHPQKAAPSYRETDSPYQALTLELCHSWLRSKDALVRLLVALFWNSLVVIWYTASFAAVSTDPGGHWLFKVMGCCFFVFPLLHVAVGLGLIHWTAALVFNATKVSVDPKGVRITHGPLPTLGARPWQAQHHEFRQLLVRRGRSDRDRHLWMLIADMEGDSLRDVIGGIQSRATADAIESTVEELLGIVDDPHASDSA